MNGLNLFNKKYLGFEVVFYNIESQKHWATDCDCDKCLPKRFVINGQIKNGQFLYNGLMSKKEIDYQKNVYNYLKDKKIEVCEVIGKKVFVEER